MIWFSEIEYRFLQVSCRGAKLAIVLNALIVAGALAQGHGKTEIQMQSRVFDLGVDPSTLRRDDTFIPIDRAPWIDAIMEADPYLHSTVIHIEDRVIIHSFPGKEPSTGLFIWAIDHPRFKDNWPDNSDVPDHMVLDGYIAGPVTPFTNRGTIKYFPDDDPYDFSVSCSYDHNDGWPNFCGMIVSYPPDPLLRTKVRVYGVTRPLNDFRAIAEHARALVYCLDVTDDVDRSERERIMRMDAADFDLLNCKSGSS